ncbi:TetR/AcrR family transcriptional regulator [Blastococcus sp. CT_GayMR20]|uniref:TetR/AcrR family transcriptional regulator n=1 Tax=Blastococcus sp. CT_GayMR20 TaxID=2559609 RepID=UPI00107461BB|nr:TetR/AcrR family transcriptional regulator [Blastococcus sp. CT_GayMR20]TFV81357.1 TetR/AcrR family transcriptional regulator [Blastococcus sp. CT_GayMR20]TFV81378.1 TetR/AcrR family transcriptional regulator [Blastococcus sp. CT_GayMR20]
MTAGPRSQDDRVKGCQREDAMVRQRRGDRCGDRRRALDPAKDEAITAAVVQVLAEVGYTGFTMDEVAMAAGVGKAAIYRRWSSKAELLIEYIDQKSLLALAVEDTGSLRGDLICLMTSVAAHLSGPAGRANRALIGVVHDDPAVFEAYRRGPLDRWAAAFRDVFERAVERGEMSPEAGTSLVAEAGPGIVIQRWLITGQPLDADMAVDVVDRVMLPLLRRPEGT